MNNAPVLMTFIFFCFLFIAHCADTIRAIYKSKYTDTYDEIGNHIAYAFVALAMLFVASIRLYAIW